jgi:hypothetical protein
MPRGRPFPKGVSGNPKGKPKGAVCKFTTLKDAFLGAFQNIGGQQAIEDWLNESCTIRDKNGKVIKIAFGDRKKEFFKMITPMLPKEVTLSGNLDVNVNTIKGIIDHASSGKSGGVQEKVPDGTG